MKLLKFLTVFVATAIAFFVDPNTLPFDNAWVLKTVISTMGAYWLGVQATEVEARRVTGNDVDPEGDEAKRIGSENPKFALESDLFGMIKQPQVRPSRIENWCDRDGWVAMVLSRPQFGRVEINIFAKGAERGYRNAHSYRFRDEREDEDGVGIDITLFLPPTFSEHVVWQYLRHAAEWSTSFVQEGGLKNYAASMGEA